MPLREETHPFTRERICKEITLIKAGLPPISSTDGVRPPMTDEQRLLKILLWNYDPAVRPVFEAKKAVVIKLGITLTQIIDVVGRVLCQLLWLRVRNHGNSVLMNLQLLHLCPGHYYFVLI